MKGTPPLVLGTETSRLRFTRMSRSLDGFLPCRCQSFSRLVDDIVTNSLLLLGPGRKVLARERRQWHRDGRAAPRSTVQALIKSEPRRALAPAEGPSALRQLLVSAPLGAGGRVIAWGGYGGGF